MGVGVRLKPRRNQILTNFVQLFGGNCDAVGIDGPVDLVGAAKLVIVRAPGGRADVGAGRDELSAVHGGTFDAEIRVISYGAVDDEDRLGPDLDGRVVDQGKGIAKPCTELSSTGRVHPVKLVSATDLDSGAVLKVVLRRAKRVARRLALTS